GALFRSGRLTLQSPDARWLLEAGDLLSDVRGLARGLRVGANIRNRWHPSIAAYARSRVLSPLDGAAASYPDAIRLPLDVETRTEANSDGSGLFGVRLLRGHTNVDAFYRTVRVRRIEERGVAVSRDLFAGVAVQLGVRTSAGAVNDRWYFGGITVP